MYNYDFAISLGSECFTNSPFIKEHYGVDKKYYPSFPLNNVKSFDFSKIILLFMNKFKGLLNTKYLIKTKDYIKNTKYDIEFIHENVLNNDSKLKYRLVRLQRLLKLKNTKFLFIRIENIFSNSYINKNIAINNCELFIKVIKYMYNIKYYKLLYIYEDNKYKTIHLYKKSKHYDIYIIPSRTNWKLNSKFISPIYNKYNVTYFKNNTYDDFLHLIHMKE